MVLRPVKSKAGIFEKNQLDFQINLYNLLILFGSFQAIVFGILLSWESNSSF